MIGCFVDVGSTFTKVRVIDMDDGALLGRTAAPTTVESDVMDGLDEALTAVEADSGVDRAAFDHRFASSSAAGGLRMVVVGFSPKYTLEAGNRAALGAGANVVGTFTWYLDDDELASVRELRPDVILLTGGTDGGNTRALTYNAEKLADAGLPCPVILAGNLDVRDECRTLLEDVGVSVTVADNIVGSSADTLHVEDAREKIRETFMDHIVDAKGIGRVRAFTTNDTILPTPDAVSFAIELLSTGTETTDGVGDAIAVDVGGATTDVHSVGDGAPTKPYVRMLEDLDEPFRKRTVEGDLGIRWNAPTILDRFGAEAIVGHVAGAAVTEQDVESYVRRVREETRYVPGDDAELAVDGALASVATDVAVERHAGRLTGERGAQQARFSAAGEAGELDTQTVEDASASGKQDRLPTKGLQVGKDLTEFATVVGTGGVLSNNAHAPGILRQAEADGDSDVLRPAAPAYYVDAEYVLFACGLLAEHHPEVALRTMRRNLVRVDGGGSSAQ